MAKAPPPKAAPAEAEAPAKPKSKKLILIVIIIFLLGAVGGGAWFFLKGGSKPAEAPKAAVVEPPTFLSMDPFAVNLLREENDQCANGVANMNIGIVLKVASSELADKVRQHMPEIRSRMLFLLSSKRASELFPVEGKKKLVREILATIYSIIEPGAAHKTVVTHEAAPVAANASGVEAAPVAAAPAAPVEAAPEGHAGESNNGALDVLFTAFIIGA